MEKSSKKSMIMAAILGGMGVAGYMYIKRNPLLMCEMKEMTKEMAKKTYDKLENID